MNRNLFAWVGVLLLAAASGCAMCDNSQDCTYGSYGGKWQRNDPSCGRVGSLFAPAGAPAMTQQDQVAPLQPSDDARQSVLVPEDDESPDEPSQDVELLDEPLQNMESSELPPVEMDVAPVKAEPVEAAPLDLKPMDDAMGFEPENAAPADLESAETGEVPAGQLPDVLDELGIKREPVEPLQPIDEGGLPPLVLPPNADE